MREFTTESQGTNTYFIYEIEKAEELDRLSMGMISNNHIPGILPLTFYQKDAKRYLQYNISSKVTLKQFFSGSVTKFRLLEVFRTITESLLLAEDYMIDPRQLILDMDHIFTNVGTAEAHLVCMPLLKIDRVINYVEFFKGIMFQTQFEQNENCDHVPTLINFLNTGGNFSLNGFRKLLIGLMQRNNNTSQRMVYESGTMDEMLHTITKPALSKPQTPSAYNQNVLPLNVTPKSNQEPSIPGDQSIDHKKEEKPKKGFLFFGKKNKEEKEKPPKREKKQKLPKAEKETKKINQPGSSSVIIPGTLIPETISAGNMTAATSIPVPNAPIPRPPVPEPKNPSAPQASYAYSGETTVLNEEVGETVVLGVENNRTQNTMVYLLRVSNQEKIFISQTVFRMGKAKDYVDYCVNNNSISRSHADILLKNGIYHIRDNNSLNHTFVDQVQIPSQVEVQLEHETKIRLANEEFEFRLH